jgi:hypothetical protein
MPGTEAQVLALELEKVEEKIAIAFERDDTFFSQVEKRPAEVVSSFAMRVPLELRPGGKPGQWTSEGGDMGTGDMPYYDKAEINTVELIWRAQWSLRRKFATDNNRKAIVNAFKRDIASAMKSFRRFNDSLCMTSNAGQLGTVGSVTTSGGQDTYICNVDGFGTRLMQSGWEIDIWDPTLTIKRTGHGPGNGGSYQINFWDVANKVVSVNGSPSLTAGDQAVQPGDIIVAQGSTFQINNLYPGNTLTANPPTAIAGVQYQNSNSSIGSWNGFNRSTTPEIRANAVVASGPFAIPMARLAINKIGNRLGMENMKKLNAWMHPAQAQQYEELAQESIIINKEAKEQGVDLYFNDNMRLAGAPVKKHFGWDMTRIDFLDMDLMGRAEFYPCRWHKDENGNRVFVGRGTSGGLQAIEFSYIICAWQMYCANPAGLSNINTLTVPSGY